MKHLSKNEIIARAMSEKAALSAAGKATLIISLVILHEEFSFDEEMLNDFVERYEDTLDYYNGSNDYQKLLKEWNDYFSEYAGISVLKSTEHLKKTVDNALNKL